MAHTTTPTDTALARAAHAAEPALKPCIRCGYIESLDGTPRNCVRCLRAALSYVMQFAPERPLQDLAYTAARILNSIT